MLHFTYLSVIENGAITGIDCVVFFQICIRIARFHPKLFPVSVGQYRLSFCKTGIKWTPTPVVLNWTMKKNEMDKKEKLYIISHARKCWMFSWHTQTHANFEHDEVLGIIFIDRISLKHQSILMQTCVHTTHEEHVSNAHRISLISKWNEMKCLFTLSP